MELKGKYKVQLSRAISSCSSGFALVFWALYRMFSRSQCLSNLSFKLVTSTCQYAHACISRLSQSQPSLWTNVVFCSTKIEQRLRCRDPTKKNLNKLMLCAPITAACPPLLTPPVQAVELARRPHHLHTCRIETQTLKTMKGLQANKYSKL